MTMKSFVVVQNQATMIAVHFTNHEVMYDTALAISSLSLPGELLRTMVGYRPAVLKGKYAEEHRN